jgi:intracellular sulfur oxidation DsrE/DsrF family protein
MQSVIHLVSGDETEQQTCLAIARNLLASGEVEDVVIAAQAAGITAIADDGEFVEKISSLLDDGVAVRACTNTLEARDMSEADLIDGVETVPEAAVEVTRLQTEENYGYLRP